jgi:hypothetical protein
MRIIRKCFEISIGLGIGRRIQNYLPKVLLHPLRGLPGQRAIKILVGDCLTGHFETLQQGKLDGVDGEAEAHLGLVELTAKLGNTRESVVQGKCKTVGRELQPASPYG